MTSVQRPKGPARLTDIFWGGRVRRAYQIRLRSIAEKAAVESDTKYEGSIISSAQQTNWNFLDGGVWEKRGWFEADCGMFVWGAKARQYVLYRLGLSLSRLLAKKEEIVPFSQLRAKLARQKREHRASKRPLHSPPVRKSDATPAAPRVVFSARLGSALGWKPHLPAARQVLLDAQEAGYEPRLLYQQSVMARPLHWPPAPTYAQVMEPDDLAMRSNQDQSATTAIQGTQDEAGS
jgi:hypothetical protein